MYKIEKSLMTCPAFIKSVWKYDDSDQAIVSSLDGIIYIQPPLTTRPSSTTDVLLSYWIGNCFSHTLRAMLLLDTKLDILLSIVHRKRAKSSIEMKSYRYFSRTAAIAVEHLWATAPWFKSMFLIIVIHRRTLCNAFANSEAARDLIAMNFEKNLRRITVPEFFVTFFL